MAITPIEFTVKYLPESSLAYTNLIYLHQDDFDQKENKKHIEVSGVVYTTAKDNSIGMDKDMEEVDDDNELNERHLNKGEVGINGPLRRKLGVNINDTINISMHEVDDDDVPIDSLHVILSKKHMGGKFNKKSFIEEEDLIIHLMSDFTRHYFYPDQQLIVKIDGDTFVMNVESGNGYLNKSSSITVDVDAKELNINLNRNKISILSKELFRNYNFENLGIGGFKSELKNMMMRTLSSRAVDPSIIKKCGIKHVKGVLLYGPTGTGKTLIAKKIGNLLVTNPNHVIVINGPEIFNKWLGNSEENIRNIFEKPKEDPNNLYVIIFDEIESICKKRDSSTGHNTDNRVVNQLLTMIDGVHAIENMFIIGMTNRKDLIDEALLRSGRIEVHIKISLPDIDGRKEIFRIHTRALRGNNFLDNDVDIDQLAELTQNFSGANIEEVVKHASSYSFQDILSSDDNDNLNIPMKYFLRAIAKTIPLFGNSISNIPTIPESFIFPNEEYKEHYDKISSFVEDRKRQSSCLLTGVNNSGKTTMIAKIAAECKCKCIKFIKSIDMIRMDSSAKSRYISECFMEICNSSDDSLFILDDIHILMEYALISGNLKISNKVFQTLKIILKTQPDNPKHKMTIISICGDKKLSEIIKKLFNVVVMIKNEILVSQ